MSSVRLVHLITSLEGGGTENFLFQILAQSPDRYQHRVFFLGRDGINGTRIRQLGIPVEKTNFWAFRGVLRREKPDVLHTCLYWGNQVGRIAGRMAGVPFILSSQRSIDVWQQPWHGLMDRLTLPLCNAIAVNSDSARRVLESRIGQRSSPPIFQVDNGLDFSIFQARDAAAARRAFHIPPSAVVGGTLMRLHEEKGAEKIPAFAQGLLEKHANLILMVAGRGPLEAELKRQTAAWGDRIRWVGWQDDSVQFLSALDFFWLLSREESFAQALLEASGIGLPWLASDVGGVRGLLDSGACGLLHPAGDLAEAVANANKLLAELKICRAKAQAAIPQIQARYQLSSMVKTFYHIVETRGA